MILCQVDNHKVFFILKIASHICLFLLLLNCPVMYRYLVLKVYIFLWVQCIENFYKSQFIKNVYYIKFVILPVQILHKFEMNMYALIFGLSVTHTRYVYTHKKKKEKKTLFQYVVKEIPSILKHFLQYALSGKFQLYGP